MKFGWNPLNSIVPNMFFRSIPFDIFTEIVQWLSAPDVFRIGQASRQSQAGSIPWFNLNLNRKQTSRYLRYIANHRAVWIRRYSRLRTVDPAISTSSLATIALRNRVMCDALVGEQWKKKMLGPQMLTKVYASRDILAAKLLLGGSHIVIIWTDGKMLLRPTVSGDVTDETVYPHVCPTNQSGFSVVEWNLLPSFEDDGYLVVNLCHDHDDLDPPHKCVIRSLQLQLVI